MINVVVSQSAVNQGFSALCKTTFIIFYSIGFSCLIIFLFIHFFLSLYLFVIYLFSLVIYPFCFILFCFAS